MSSASTQPDVASAAVPVPAASALDDRLLAEVVRLLEQDGAKLRHEPVAERRGMEAGGELEQRIMRRAASLGDAPELRRSLNHVIRTTGWITLLAIMLGALAGAAAVRTALGTAGGEPVNFFWLLTSLLGVQVLLLVLWLVLIIVRPGSTVVSPLGAAALGVGRWLASAVYARRDRARSELAAAHAAALVFGRGAAGRWTFSAISHAIWCAFNVGCFILLIVMLSVRSYTFNWETTILSGDAYVQVTRGLSAAPELAGFRTPTDEQIADAEAGRASADMADASRRWSQLLIASMLIYGFAPRALALVLCLQARKRALRRYRLDLNAPGFRALRDRLMPSAQRRGVVGIGANELPDEAAGAVRRVHEIRTEPGQPAIVGIEIDQPACPWPPPLHDVRWIDLGFLGGRDERRRALAELADFDPPVQSVVVVCALTSTPDRGFASIIEQLARAARAPLAMVLTAGQALRERADAEGVSNRVADWRGLATRVGVADGRVMEIDLDHLTEATQRRMVALIAEAPDQRDDDGAAVHEDESPDVERRLEAAFSLIDEAAGAWPDDPGVKEQAELHRRIAGVFEPDRDAWSRLLNLPESGSLRDVAGSVREAATHVVSRLPDRVRKSPRWLAAGALTGAVGCLAAATFVAPVAIASLPMWSVIGGAVGVVIQQFTPPAPGDSLPGADDGDQDQVAEARFDDAVRAAALLAMLLQLQGRDEASISRVLDAAIGDGTVPLIMREHIASWLDEMRHRFDLALAREENRSEADA